MKRCSAKGIYSAVWIVGAVILQACAPLTNVTSTNSGNCIAGVTANNTAVGIGQTGGTPLGFVTAINTQAVAQSFPATSATSFTVVSLNLDLISPANTTSPGALQVDIEPDSVVPTNGSTGTPTTPGGAGTTLGTASITIASNTIPYNTNGLAPTPQFVSFTFPTSISLTVGHIYWIVATPNYSSPSATTYVEWRAATTQLLDQVADYFSTTGIWTSLGTTLNMDFRVGC
jgi:hypothetical protein